MPKSRNKHKNNKGKAKDNDLDNKLIEAVEEGNITKISRLIKKGANIETKDQSGRTPLIIASTHNEKFIIDLFLKEGADINATDIHGNTALIISTIANNTESVNLLIERKANLEAKNEDPTNKTERPEAEDIIPDDGYRSLGCDYGNTALMMAAKLNHINIVNILLEAGANIETQDLKGNTLLLIAAENSRTELMTILLAKNANIENKNYDDNTALIAAAHNKHKECLELLIAKGANLEVENIFGKTPLINAAKNNNTEVITLLLEKEANIENRGSLGITALFMAAAHNSTESLELLIDKGANLEAPAIRSEAKEIDERFNNWIGKTPLLIAAQYNNINIFKTLLKAGADIRCSDNEGITSTMHAAAKDKDDSLEILKLSLEKIKEKEINIDQMDYNLDTALYYNIMYSGNNKDSLKMLIKAGASINIQNAEGLTLLMIAVKYELKEIIETLIKEGADLTIKNDEGLTALDIAERGDPALDIADRVKNKEICNILKEALKNHYPDFASNSDLKGISRNDNAKLYLNSSKHLLNKLDGIINDVKKIHQSNERYSNIRTTFKHFLNDNITNIDPDHTIRNYQEIYKTASIILDVFSQDPRNLIWADEIVEPTAFGCKDDPILAITEINAIMPIIEAEGTLNKILATKQHRALKILSNLVENSLSKLNDNNSSYDPTRTNAKECRSEGILFAYREAHDELQKEGLISQPWFGVPQEIIINEDSLSKKNWLNDIASEARKIAPYLINISDRIPTVEKELINYAHGGSLKTAWSLIAFPKETLGIKKDGIEKIDLIQESYELATKDPKDFDNSLSQEEYNKYSKEEKETIKNYATFSSEERMTLYKEIKNQTEGEILDASRKLALKGKFNIQVQEMLKTKKEEWDKNKPTEMSTLESDKKFLETYTPEVNKKLFHELLSSLSKKSPAEEENHEDRPSSKPSTSGAAESLKEDQSQQSTK